MIEPTFNQLTFLPLCKTDEEVELRLNNFVSLLAKLKEYGINRVRIEETFSQMPLKDGLSLYDVFSQDIKSPDSARRNRGLLLAGTLRRPAVTEDIEPEFYGDEDLDRCVCTSVEPEQDCIGLYVADILKSFSVGFAQSWLDTNKKKKCEIRILHKDESKNKNSAVLCMTTADDENHEMFIELMWEKPFEAWFERHHWNGKPLKIIRFIKLVIIVLIGEMFFRAATFSAGWTMLKYWFTSIRPGAMYANLRFLGMDSWDWLTVSAGFIPVIIVSVLNEKQVALREKFDALPMWKQLAVIYAAILVIVIFGAYGPGYNAVAMMYAGF